VLTSFNDNIAVSPTPKAWFLLHVQAMGSETGIVLIHGYGGGAFSWRHVLGPLARSTGCRVIAFDRPAFGALQICCHAEDSVIKSSRNLLMRIFGRCLEL